MGNDVGIDARVHSTPEPVPFFGLDAGFTEQGQCRYLAIFIRLLQLRHPQLLRMSQEEQVRFLSTAYNYSFTASWDDIIRMQSQCHFHTDVIKTRNTRFYCYSAIAVCFWRKE